MKPLVTTKIYDADQGGVLVGEFGKCPEKPLFEWYELASGILIGLLIFMRVVML